MVKQDIKCIFTLGIITKLYPITEFPECKFNWMSGFFFCSCFGRCHILLDPSWADLDAMLYEHNLERKSFHGYQKNKTWEVEIIPNESLQCQALRFLRK